MAILCSTNSLHWDTYTMAAAECLHSINLIMRQFFSFSFFFVFLNLALFSTHADVAWIDSRDTERRDTNCKLRYSSIAHSLLLLCIALVHSFELWSCPERAIKELQLRHTHPSPCRWKLCVPIAYVVRSSVCTMLRRLVCMHIPSRRRTAQQI